MTDYYIAFGSNLGDGVQRAQWVIQQLKSRLSLTRIKLSKLYLTTPVECASGTPRYINGVIALSCNENPETLLLLCQALEKEAGRVVSQIKNADRPLDLDLLCSSPIQVINQSQLILPHPRLHLRAFVLLPLSELAGELILDIGGKALLISDWYKWQQQQQELGLLPKEKLEVIQFSENSIS
jgi:2-amino-4-hydroxy-6-hydroxymethyldihydropteridine diphosphokinase